MKKFLLIPDSFKGTMSSQEICDIMQRAITHNIPGAEIIKIPVADGGEGSVDAFLSALSGERRSVTVSGPFGESVAACYGVVDGGRTAVIEMAACAGLPLVGEHPDPLRATTYGVGELIAHAAKSGCKKIIVGLGGSATNDAGAGAASALGVCFSNAAGETFVPTGGTLERVAHIDLSGLMTELSSVEILTMCDIDNPLFGETGAAHVFAPQKGADEEMVRQLDRGLRHMDEVVRRDLGRDLAGTPGAGAAGGMGFGMLAFLSSKLQMGIETVLDTVRFDELLDGVDLVLTGEGKIDSQSIRGKVVIGVAARTQRAGVPLIAIVGDIGDGAEAAYDRGVSGIFSINRVAVPYREAKLRAHDDLYLTVDNLFHFLGVVHR